jgi:hypothetical protein
MKWAWTVAFLSVGCATVRAPGSGAGELSQPVTLTGVPPTDWDEAFHKLVAGCPDEANGPVIDFDTAFQLGFTLLSVGVGAYVISQRPADATTISIGIVGGVAAVGVLAGLVIKIVSRIRGNTEGHRVKVGFLAAWASAQGPERSALVQKIAAQCNEGDVAAAYLNALGAP